MYNPFPPSILKAAMFHIGSSIQRRRRTVTLIYRNPPNEDLVATTGFLKIREFHQGGSRCTVYNTVGDYRCGCPLG
jgi:hypothetical protein